MVVVTDGFSILSKKQGGLLVSGLMNTTLNGPMEPLLELSQRDM